MDGFKKKSETISLSKSDSVEGVVDSVEDHQVRHGFVQCLNFPWTGRLCIEVHELRRV
jgi:hypothetical protein